MLNPICEAHYRLKTPSTIAPYKRIVHFHEYPFITKFASMTDEKIVKITVLMILVKLTLKIVHYVFIEDSTGCVKQQVR